MDVNGVPFKCERCGSSRGRREKRELRGQGPVAVDVAFLLRCEECGLAVEQAAWLTKNRPAPA